MKRVHVLYEIHTYTYEFKLLLLNIRKFYYHYYYYDITSKICRIKIAIIIYY